MCIVQYDQDREKKNEHSLFPVKYIEAPVIERCHSNARILFCFFGMIDTNKHLKCEQQRDV